MDRIIHFLSTSRTALILLLATLLTATAAQTAWAQELTDFLPVSSSGTASGYFAFSDHFYKVDWTGINTAQTTSVQLNYNSQNGNLRAYRNGNTSSYISLYTNADVSWGTSDITGLTPGQSSDGYTTYDALSVNVGTKKAKVCTVTCMAANTPTWNWSADYSTCTATFTCTASPSLTTTVDATVTRSGSTATASATFNGTNYTDTKTIVTYYDITYVLNGGTNAAGNPTTYADNVGVASFANPTRTGYTFAGWYDNASFTGSPVTNIPAGSSGNKTLYAKWTPNTYTVSYNANGGSGTMSSQTFTYDAAQNLRANTFTRTGYTFGGWATTANGAVAYADKQSVSNLTSTQGADVELFAKWMPSQTHFSQSGDTYTIHTAGGWNVFCDLLAENTKGYFSGKTVELGDNITVTRMAGGDNHDFTGTFDGNDNTLTFSHTATDNYCAPFRNVQGATAETPAVIHNLNVVSTVTAADYRHPAGLIALQSGHVSVTDCNVEAHISNTKGTANPSDLYPAALVSQSNGVLTVSGCTTTGQIATDGKYAAGLIGIVQNTATIDNCRVSVTIQSTTSGDGTHGGLVASQTSKNPITITGCVFDGRLLGSATNKCGGFIGWRNSTATIYNSLFAPTEVTVQNSGSATFARNDVDTYNCYYTTLLNDGTNYAPAYVGGTETPNLWHNGKATRTVAAGTDVTIKPIALTGAATQYTVSGITAYSGGGMQLGETLYYGSDDQLSLTLSNTAAPLGYQYTYVASAGTLSGTTLTMPDENVTISVNTAGALTTIDWATESEGTEAAPYMIYNKDQLNLLAQRVNNGTSGYTDKYFKLGNDIIYDPDELTIDNDNDGTNDSNYEPIGGRYDDFDRYFRGTFDGANHTVSGIRIYKGGTGDGDGYQGLFGQIVSSADIRNVTLADADITGGDYTGGIVGENEGTVSDCHVAASVFIRAVQEEAHGHGGIVGYNLGTVTNCTSRSTLAIAGGVTGCQQYGGIAGLNFGTLTDNLAIGAVVPAADGNTYGAICGNRGGTMARNYYRACKVASENVTQGGVGCSNRDVTDNNGAVPAFALTLDTGITTTSEPVINIDNEDYYAGTITLSGGLPDGAPEHYTYAYTVNGNAISGNTFTISADATVSIDADNLYPADWADEGNSGDDEDHAYIIYNKDQLNLLAQRVNNGTSDYKDKYFKLGNDIIYAPDELTIDNDNDGTNDSNYETIGGFNGHFDGQGHTVSGIRIYKGGTGDGDGYQGLFGRTGSSADIRNVTLADADITGYCNTGGIVGENYGTVSDCHVAASVFIRAVQKEAHRHGGIVGYNRSTVTNCTSRSTLAIAKGITGCQHYGGITGLNFGTLTDNLAIGAVVPAAYHYTYGAICGNGGGTMARNYYRACKVASENVTQGGVGGHNSDVTDNNGAVPACTLTLDTGITTTSETVINIDNEDYYAGTITLSGDLPDGAPEHYTYAYTVNGNAISGNTFIISADATVGIGIGPADWANEGNSGDDEDHAYIIYNKDQLNLLAHRVNGTNSETANDYEGKYFKLGNDITYNPDELTIDNNNDGTNDSNYEAIGGFNGHFDGQGHTVSGIRIYKSAYYGDWNQGLFGWTGSSADIHNVTLANADITGGDFTGGIVGENNGTVSNCHVTATVAIHTIQPDVWDHGGIVGENLGTIRECISAATLTNTGNGYCTEYGGIAGFNHGTMSNNLAIGAVVPEAAENNAYGAICGWNYDGTLENNYYAACTVAGVANAVGVGCGGISDSNDGYTVADIDGAVPALRDNADNSDALALVAKIATAGFEDSPLDLGWGEGEYPMQLAGRTLYKDGSWNTLCLPFDISTASGTLSGDNVQAMTLNTTTSSLADGTLTLNFDDATGQTIPAGTPFIIKWDKPANYVAYDGQNAATCSDLVNPVFMGVTIDAEKHDATVEGVLTFTGTYAPVSIPSEGDNTKLYLGAANKLYYPTKAMTIGTHRAYFQLSDGITAGEPAGTEGSGQDVRAFVLNFGDDEATGIISVHDSGFMVNGSDAWYTLDGRRLDGQPTAKGLYIHGGKKVIVK